MFCLGQLLFTALDQTLFFAVAAVARNCPVKWQGFRPPMPAFGIVFGAWRLRELRFVPAQFLFYCFQNHKLRSFKCNLTRVLMLRKADFAERFRLGGRIMRAGFGFYSVTSHSATGAGSSTSQLGEVVGRFTLCVVSSATFSRAMVSHWLNQSDSIHSFINKLLRE